MRDYKTIFDKIESALINYGSHNLAADAIRAKLDEFKRLEGKAFSDADYHWILVYVIFYSGFRAETVNVRLDLIRNLFSDYETVAVYDGNSVKEILTAPQMIRNRRKIQACIENAKVFKSIVCEYGSFQAYVDSFAPASSFENLMLLKEELEYRFEGLGRITTYHVLTDIGLPVLKPDRVIYRIFQRLGIIESDKQLLKTVIQGRKFAKATNHPIRYIDRVFVAYGQIKSQELGLDTGICLEQSPLCSVCGVTEYCKCFAQKSSSLESLERSAYVCKSKPKARNDRQLRTEPSSGTSQSNRESHRLSPKDITVVEKSMFVTHGVQAKRFAWTFEDDHVKIRKEKRKPKDSEDYPLGEIFDVLNWLREKFGPGWFPLANNVEKLWLDNETDGLGVAILRQRPRKISHAQGASYLGVVLEHVGILKWNNRQRGIQWRIIRPDMNPDELRKAIKAKMPAPDPQ